MRTDVEGEQGGRVQQVRNAVNLRHEQTSVNAIRVGAVFSDWRKNKCYSFQLLYVLLRCTQNLYWQNIFIIFKFLEMVCHHGELNVHLVASYLRVKCMFSVWLASARGHIDCYSNSKEDGLDTGFWLVPRTKHKRPLHLRLSTIKPHNVFLGFKYRT